MIWPYLIAETALRLFARPAINRWQRGLFPPGSMYNVVVDESGWEHIGDYYFPPSNTEYIKRLNAQQVQQDQQAHRVRNNPYRGPGTTGGSGNYAM